MLILSTFLEKKIIKKILWGKMRSGQFLKSDTSRFFHLFGGIEFHISLNTSLHFDIDSIQYKNLSG